MKTCLKSFFGILVFSGFTLSGCAHVSRTQEVSQVDQIRTQQSSLREIHSLSTLSWAEASRDLTGALEYPIIDAHTHTGFNGEPEESSGILHTKESMIAEMKRAGVGAAVAHQSRDGRGGQDLSDMNVIHCAGVPARPNTRMIEEGLRSKQFRCIKIYLGYVWQYPSDKNYLPLYRLAEKYNVPVVFHTGDTYSIKGKLKYSDPLTVDEVAVDFPKVKFVIAHSGNPWIESAAEVAYKNPNVYLDGSALLVGNLDTQPAEKIEQYVVKPLAWIFGYLENPSKLMFGTDYPLTHMEPYVRAFKRAIPKEHWKAVFHDNAVSVFGIEDGTSKTQLVR